MNLLATTGVDDNIQYLDVKKIRQWVGDCGITDLTSPSWTSAVQPAARGGRPILFRQILCGPPVLAKFVRNLCTKQVKDKT